VTELHGNGPRTLRAGWRIACAVAACGLAAAALVAMTGCTGGGQGKSAGSAVTSPTVGQNMAGPAVQVHIPQSAISARPQPWNLSTPVSAVRSYLDWTSYALRIAESSVATGIMGGREGVRVDSYIQFNLEKKRLLDQSLTSITFGKQTVESTHTLVPTKEQWAYSYRSIDVGNKVIGGPYSATYNATYTVVKTAKGWVVDSVDAKAVGAVK
jgi:hypothetical protein